MQLLRDNLTLWTSELIEEDGPKWNSIYSAVKYYILL
jgi:hypothetical protein